jgi:hypothetical protein
VGLRPSAFRHFFFILFQAFWPSATRYVVMMYKEAEAGAACSSGSTAWYVSVVIRLDASIACTVASAMPRASARLSASSAAGRTALPARSEKNCGYVLRFGDVGAVLQIARVVGDDPGKTP